MKSDTLITLGGKEILAKDFKELLLKCLSTHSSRRLTHLYLNIANMKNRLLVFTNTESNSLVKINNAELVFRIVRIKNKNDWDILMSFFNDYILKSHFDKNSAPVISLRVDFILAYLNKIDYDLNKLDIKINRFFSLSYINEKKKKIIIGNLERDYLVLYKIINILKEFMLDEKDLYNENKSKFNFITMTYDKIIKKINETNYIVIDFDKINKKYQKIKAIITNSLDIFNIDILGKMKETDYTLYLIIKEKAEISLKFITYVILQDMDIITTRPYMSYLGKKRRKIK